MVENLNPREMVFAGMPDLTVRKTTPPSPGVTGRSVSRRAALSTPNQPLGLSQRLFVDLLFSFLFFSSCFLFSSSI